MKIFKGIVALLLILIMGNSALAATVEMSDASKAEVTVTVTGRQNGEYINILVAKSDITIAELEADVTKLEHQGSVVSTGTGEDRYVFTLNIPAGFISGDYNIYISGETEPCNLYYLPFASIVTIAKDNIVGQTDKNQLALALETYKRELSIINDLYNNADKVSVAQKLIDSLNNSPITLLDEATQAAEIAELQRRIKVFSCLSCFEEGKKDVLYSTDGDYLYNDLVPISNIDANGITINSAFNSLLNDTGKSNATDALFNKEYTDVASIQAQYAKAVIVNCIKNSIYEGFGFLTDVITEDNARLAGLSITEYLALSDKSTANRNIVASKQTVTETNLENIIKNAVPSTTPVINNGVVNNNNNNNTAPSPSIVIPSATNTGGQSEVSKKFSDIEDHWAEESIEYLTEKKILSGYPDNSFRPDIYVKREEACKIIAIAFNKTSLGDVAYNDVKADDWFYPYVSSLTKLNIVNGVADGVFGTGKNMTREAFAVLIYRLLGLSNAEQTNDFTDKDTISDWATAAVDALVENDIINGFDDGSFQPQKALTRAEVSKIIYSIISTQEG